MRPSAAGEGYGRVSKARREQLAMGPSGSSLKKDRTLQRSKARITVVARKRPISSAELSRSDIDIAPTSRQQDPSSSSRIVVEEARKTVWGDPFIESHAFDFDRTYFECHSNKFVYESCVRPLVEAVMSQGTRCSLFAFGQTGSGKTYTMVGPHKNAKISESVPEEEQGVWVHASRDLFNWMNSREVGGRLGLFVSFFEIYCNKVYDLLNDRRLVRALETNTKDGVVVKGLTVCRASDLGELMDIISCGFARRITAQNSKNRDSSRGHAILTLDIRDVLGQHHKRYGKLAFVDLAGSERGADSIVAGRQTQQDGAGINKSLLALKECIRMLDMQSSHVPFRDSELTKVLRDMFIGSHARTVMIANVAPSTSCCDQTLNTLRYAERVRAMRTNCEPDVQEHELCRKVPQIELGALQGGEVEDVEPSESRQVSRTTTENSFELQATTRFVSLHSSRPSKSSNRFRSIQPANAPADDEAGMLRDGSENLVGDSVQYSRLGSIQLRTKVAAPELSRCYTVEPDAASTVSLGSSHESCRKGRLSDDACATSSDDGTADPLVDQERVVLSPPKIIACLDDELAEATSPVSRTPDKHSPFASSDELPKVAMDAPMSPGRHPAAEAPRRRTASSQSNHINRSSEKQRTRTDPPQVPIMNIATQAATQAPAASHGRRQLSLKGATPASSPTPAPSPQPPGNPSATRTRPRPDMEARPGQRRETCVGANVSPSRPPRQNSVSKDHRRKKDTPSDEISIRTTKREATVKDDATAARRTRTLTPVLTHAPWRRRASGEDHVLFEAVGMPASPREELPFRAPQRPTVEVGVAPAKTPRTRAPKQQLPLPAASPRKRSQRIEAKRFVSPQTSADEHSCGVEDVSRRSRASSTVFVGELKHPAKVREVLPHIPLTPKSGVIDPRIPNSSFLDLDVADQRQLTAVNMQLNERINQLSRALIESNRKMLRRMKEGMAAIRDVTAEPEEGEDLPRPMLSKLRGFIEYRIDDCISLGEVLLEVEHALAARDAIITACRRLSANDVQFYGKNECEDSPTLRSLPTSSAASELFDPSDTDDVSSPTLQLVETTEPPRHRSQELPTRGLSQSASNHPRMSPASQQRSNFWQGSTVHATMAGNAAKTQPTSPVRLVSAVDLSNRRGGDNGSCATTTFLSSEQQQQLHLQQAVAQTTEDSLVCGDNNEEEQEVLMSLGSAHRSSNTSAELRDNSVTRMGAVASKERLRFRTLMHQKNGAVTETGGFAAELMRELQQQPEEKSSLQNELLTLERPRNDWSLKKCGLPNVSSMAPDGGGGGGGRSPDDNAILVADVALQGLRRRSQNAPLFSDDPQEVENSFLTNHPHVELPNMEFERASEDFIIRATNRKFKTPIEERFPGSWSSDGDSTEGV